MTKLNCFFCSAYSYKPKNPFHKDYRFEVFPERQKLGDVYNFNVNAWRWRFVAPNNKIIADGGEAYSSVRACLLAIKRFVNIMEFGFIPFDEVARRPKVFVRRFTRHTAQMYYKEF